MSRKIPLLVWIVLPLACQLLHYGGLAWVHWGDPFQVALHLAGLLAVLLKLLPTRK